MWAGLRKGGVRGVWMSTVLERELVGKKIIVLGGRVRREKGGDVFAMVIPMGEEFPRGDKVMGMFIG